MPVYESETVTSKDLQKMRREHRCSECHDTCDVFLAPDGSGRVMLACRNYPSSKHDGVERVHKVREENYESKIRRAVQMEKEQGLEKTKALAAETKSVFL